MNAPLSPLTPPAPRRIARTTIDAVPALTAADRDAMFGLMVRYYSGVTREQFERDLDEKPYLIRMHDDAGGLAGFSTLQLLEREHAGRRSVVVFSGDTVIDRDCWGQKALQQAFTRFLVRTYLRNPTRPVYWFLISKGYKTYLLMRHNFASWPNHRGETPPEVQAVLDHVAQLKYPDHYDPARGVLTFPDLEETAAVRPEHCDVSPELLANPEISFFLEKNPGWVRGDELCCLAKVRLRELLWIGLKYGLWHPLRRLLGLGPRRAPRPALAEAAAAGDA